MKFQDYRELVQQSFVWWPWLKYNDWRFNRMMRVWDKDKFK